MYICIYVWLIHNMHRYHICVYTYLHTDVYIIGPDGGGKMSIPFPLVDRGIRVMVESN